MNYNIIVSGSDDYGDYEKAKKYIKYYISRILGRGDQVTILTTGDKTAEQFAREENLECRKYMADWKRDGKAAGAIRNEKLIRAAFGCIAFTSPYIDNKGTTNLINLAKLYGVPYKIVEDD